jgi:hypothetical protein
MPLTVHGKEGRKEGYMIEIKNRCLRYEQPSGRSVVEIVELTDVHGGRKGA